MGESGSAGTAATGAPDGSEGGLASSSGDPPGSEGSTAGPMTSSTGGDTTTGGRSGFAQCRRLSIINPPVEVLEGVPVLVRLLDDPARFDYDLAAPDGADLRFFDVELTTELPHEIERWQDHGESIVWVRVPSIGGGAQQLWMCFGQPGLEDAADPAAVWEGHYTGVWHFEIDDRNDVRDSTSNGLDGSLGGAASMAAVGPGRIGQGLTFEQPGSRVNVSDQPALDLTDVVMIEGWVRVDAVDYDANRYLLRKRDAYFLHVMRDWTIDPYFYVYRAFSPYSVSTGQPLPAEQWVHLAGSFDRAERVARIWLDGALVGEYDYSFTLDLPIDTSDYPLDLGNDLEGSFDEVRLSSVRHSTAWIELQYRSGADVLLQFGPAEPDPMR